MRDLDLQISVHGKKISPIAVVDESGQRRTAVEPALLKARLEALPSPRDADERTLRLCFSETDAIAASIALSKLGYREIAGRMGCSKSLVNAWAKGERPLTHKRTRAFCVATGTNLIVQYREMERALREATGRLRARDRIAAIVAPTERAWSHAA